MINKLLFIALTVFAQSNVISAQRQWVLPTTTAAEMRNPYTWYWPYAIAAAEGYRDYFKNAQQISNQLYQQAYATQAFSWTTGQAGQAAGQAGQAAGQAGQTAGQVTNPNWNGQGQGGQGNPGGQWNGGQGGQGQWNGGQGGQGQWNGGQGGQSPWNGGQGGQDQWNGGQGGQGQWNGGQGGQDWNGPGFLEG